MQKWCFCLGSPLLSQTHVSGCDRKFWWSILTCFSLEVDLRNALYNLMIYTLPETHIAPENKVSQKESCFHTSIFEGLVSFRESNGDQKIVLHQEQPGWSVFLWNDINDPDNERWKKPRCLGYIGDYTTQLCIYYIYGDYIISNYEDPYWTTNIMECYKGFDDCLKVFFARTAFHIEIENPSLQVGYEGTSGGGMST